MKWEFLSILVLVCGFCSGEVFELNNGTTYPELWDIRCFYSPNIEDFWVWGSECNGVNLDEPVEESQNGFFTGCGKPCSIIFDTGKFINPIDAINISLFTDANSQIFLYGMNSIDDANQQLIDSFTETSWLNRTFDFSQNPQYKVLNVTVIPSVNNIFGSVFVESLAIEAKVVENAKVVLDTALDSSNEPEWVSVNCFYGNDYETFKAAKCPIPFNEVPHPRNGFYKPCRQSTCEFIYYSNLLAPPKALNFAYYMSGSGNSSIVISGKSDLKQKVYKQLQTITKSAGVWAEEKILLEGENELFGKVIKITAIQEGRMDMEFHMDQVLIDKITVDVNNLNPVTPYPDPDEPTTPVGENTTLPPKNTTPSEKDASMRFGPIASLIAFFIFISRLL